MKKITEYIKPYLDSLNLGAHADLAAQVLIIILATLIIGFIVGRVLASLEKFFDKNENKWDDAVVYAFRSPLVYLINIIGIFYAIEIIHEKTEEPIFAGLDSLRDVILIFLLAWGVKRFITKAQENIHERAEKRGRKIDPTTSDAIANILKVAVFIIAALMAMQTYGLSISGVLAFGGVGGIAIGFAARDLLANFFGALTIYFDKPFGKGDWIRSPDRNIEGTVEKIGWRMTQIRTFDKRPLYVPNSVFTTIAVENPSRMRNRRISETIGVRYVDVAVVKKIGE